MAESPGNGNPGDTGPEDVNPRAGLSDQWWSCWAFLTRLPCPAHAPVALGQAAWAMPLVGLAVGMIGAGVMGAGQSLGLGALASAAFAVAAAVWVTGALHEDGLADCADAFGLRRPAGRTHAILKDPRMGAFGVVTLVLSLLLRVLLAAEAGPLALLTAEVLSRAAMALAMAISPAAGAGSAAAAGRASLALTGIAAMLSLGLGIGLSGLGALLGSVLALAGSVYVLSVGYHRIGGHTGDVLGAVQQVSLIGVLLGLAVAQ